MLLNQCRENEKEIFTIYVTEKKGWKFMSSNILRTETFPNKIVKISEREVKFTKIFAIYTLSSHDS